MYKLTLGRCYDIAAFEFETVDEALEFGKYILNHQVYISDLADPLKIYIHEVEKCAEGGNPETAHDENQE